VNVIKLIFSTIIIILIASCANKQDYPLIYGKLYKYIDYSNDTVWQRYFEVFDIDGLPMIPLVKLNSAEVEMYQFDYIQCIYYDDTVHFATNQEYELTVDHYYGQANCKIWMPGDFSMISPGPTYILKSDSVLFITWHKSERASWYWLSVDGDYDYEDSFGEWDNYEFYHDTVVYDTFVRYARNRFIPDYVKNIIEGEAEAGVWALDGPNCWKPGTKGNIRGQGFGYFYSIYEPRLLDFYVGAPPKTPKLKNRSKVWDRLKAKVKKFQKNP
jgi:hypothetical protein